jgi:predicted flap endonuclease-1-like 5' DNA nuclease
VAILEGELAAARDQAAKLGYSLPETTTNGASTNETTTNGATTNETATNEASTNETTTNEASTNETTTNEAESRRAGAREGGSIEVGSQEPGVDTDTTARSGADAPSAAAFSADHRDDLKAIKGIGPVIERTLNRIGIQTYEQLASLTRADIEKVSAAIESFAGRIEREDWIGSAQRLLDAGHRPEPA